WDVAAESPAGCEATRWLGGGGRGPRGWGHGGWGHGACGHGACDCDRRATAWRERAFETTAQCRDHGAVPRPRRSAEASAETTVERRDHCARAVGLGAPPLFRGAAVCSCARLLQSICDGHFDLGEDLRSEEVAEREVEDGESCIGEVHVALVVLASGGVRAVRVHVVFADAVDFHDDGSFIMPEVVPADEFACR